LDTAEDRGAQERGQRIAVVDLAGRRQAAQYQRRLVDDHRAIDQGQVVIQCGRLAAETVDISTRISRRDTGRDQLGSDRGCSVGALEPRRRETADRLCLAVVGQRGRIGGEGGCGLVDGEGAGNEGEGVVGIGTGGGGGVGAGIGA